MRQGRTPQTGLGWNIRQHRAFGSGRSAAHAFEHAFSRATLTNGFDFFRFVHIRAFSNNKWIHAQAGQVPHSEAQPGLRFVQELDCRCRTLEAMRTPRLLVTH